MGYNKNSTILFPFLQVFREMAYLAHGRDELLAGVDEFMTQVSVLPPGKFDPEERIEPPYTAPSQVLLTDTVFFMINTPLLLCPPPPNTFDNNFYCSDKALKPAANITHSGIHFWHIYRCYLEE